MKKFLKTALISTAVAFAGQAHAALLATLTFNTPFAIVASDQPVDVFLTLTLDAASDALTTDTAGRPTSGFDFAGYTGPIDLNDPNTRVLLNESYQCGGSFVGLCGSGPYSFDFNFNQPNFIGPRDFDLQPGQSFSWLFGTFNPVSGNAPPGLYDFFNAGAIVQIYNPGDPNDPNDDQFDSISIAQTCPSQDRSCAFVREVYAVNSAVPEPATWAMMLFGFALIGSTLRRRVATRVSALA
jgi:PEP-CTERM motif